ncbi:MAG: AIR synthase family protein, partial [Bacillota bacterium]|nr:AIR synthase family protein [Bacillota bacterium]
CAAINVRGNICVLTTDPITAADADMGVLSLLVTCNDLAAFGAQPVAVVATLLAPPDAHLAAIEKLVIQMEHTARELGVEIVGGHTEVTDAVRRLVISAAALGTCHKDALILPGGAREGDALVMTKWAGLEGTAIIAADHQPKLSGVLSPEELNEALALKKSISVVKEGLLGAKNKAHAMHDVTEGGVLGAAWEIAEAAGIGVEIIADDVPVLPVTRKICSHFRIDPLKLISSGCMLIAHPDAAKLITALNDEGIPAKVIGRFTKHKKTLITSGKEEPLAPPEADEIFKLKQYKEKTKKSKKNKDRTPQAR